ncbi:MAG: alpha/beta hydrolase [Phaeodactylibacter sp.]|uniref:alpha/beta fold hydrolase n=1 Tax=Phaeodactylibacter sp. TaxID=1940289 RepID=UPI0032EB125D
MPVTKDIRYLSSDYQDPSPEQPVRYPPVLKLIRFFFGTLGYLFPKPMAKLAYRFFSTPRIRAHHKTSDELLESARLFEFMYGKQLLKGYEWGYGGRTILLVHGWESRGTALRTFVPPLLEKGYRVVAFDGPAHGNSDGKRTNLPHFGGAVRAIINQIGGVHGIITHSFGGASTAFALSNLDPSIKVEKLVLIGVPDKMKTVLNNAMQTLKVPPPAAREFFRFIEQKVKFPVQHADTSRAHISGSVGKALIVHDETDAIVAIQEARSIFEAWENASMLITKGYGHYRLMKNPDLIREVADFIDAG